MTTAKTTTLNLKPKLVEILILTYKFRFLNRSQIQTLLHHKYHNRINEWLNYLTCQKYLKRYYSQRFAGSAAYYSLGTQARKYFKKRPEISGIKEKLLDRVWTENKNSGYFKNHCLFLADIYLSLTKLGKESKAELNFYTKVDLFGMRYMVRPEPSAYFSLKDGKGVTKRYFLDIFDYFIPKELYKRFGKYVYYFEKRYWQNNTDKPFPEIILVCPNKAAKNFLGKTISAKIKEKGLDMCFLLTEHEEIKRLGMCRQVLHKVVPLD